MLSTGTTTRCWSSRSSLSRLRPNLPRLPPSPPSPRPRPCSRLTSWRLNWKTPLRRRTLEALLGLPRSTTSPLLWSNSCTASWLSLVRTFCLRNNRVDFFWPTFLFRRRLPTRVLVDFQVFCDHARLAQALHARVSERKRWNETFGRASQTRVRHHQAKVRAKIHRLLEPY